MAQQADERTVAPPPTSSDLALKSITIKGVKVDIPEGKTSASVDLSWKDAKNSSTGALENVGAYVTNPATGTSISVTDGTGTTVGITSSDKDDITESLTTAGGQVVWTVKVESDDATVDPVFYTIRINIAKADTDSTLKSLFIKGVEVDLTKAGTPGGTTGAVTIDLNDTVVITAADNASDELKVDATPTNPKAVVTIKTAGANGLAIAGDATDKGALTYSDGTAKDDSVIKVTAEDGSYTEYTLKSVKVERYPVGITLTDNGATVKYADGTTMANNDRVPAEELTFTVEPPANKKITKVEKKTNSDAAAVAVAAGTDGSYTVDLTGATTVAITITVADNPEVTFDQMVLVNGKAVNSVFVVENGSVTFTLQAGQMANVGGTAGTDYTDIDVDGLTWTINGVKNDIAVTIS